MLPDIRAVLAALVAAVALLTVSFALVATFRVAQENRSTALQASFVNRARAAQSTRPPDESRQRVAMIVETPGPHLAPVPPALDPPIAVKVARVAEPAPEAVPVARVDAEPLLDIAALLVPPAEPPMGGPFAAPPAPKAELPRVAAVDPIEPDITKKEAEQSAAEKKLAAEKARKARAARIARERKAAARRAALARAAKQKANPFGNNQFGNNTFGGTFTAGQ